MRKELTGKEHPTFSGAARFRTRFSTVSYTQSHDQEGGKEVPRILKTPLGLLYEATTVTHLTCLPVGRRATKIYP